MVRRSLKADWGVQVLPGSERPCQRNQRDHRRTRGGTARTSATSTDKPLIQPRRIRTRWRIPHDSDILGGPGKHSRHLWVWFGQCYHTRKGVTQPRELTLQCSDRLPVVRGSPEGNGWCTPHCRGPSLIQYHPRRLRSA